MIANQQTFLVKNEPYLLFKGQLYEIEHGCGEANDKFTQTKCKFEKETMFEKPAAMFDKQAAVFDKPATAFDKPAEGRPQAKKELNSKVKKITCKLRMFQMGEQTDEPIENNKDTQGDILNMLKWTRSKSKLKNLDLVNKVLDLDCDEPATELFR